MLRKFLAVLGVVLLWLFLAEFFVGRASSVWISRSDGSLRFTESVVCPWVIERPLEHIVEEEVYETAYARFLAEHGRKEKKQWVRAGNTVDSVFLNRQVRSLSDAELRALTYPIMDFNEARIYEFLLYKHETDEGFMEDLREYFFQMPGSLAQGYLSGLDDEYSEWLVLGF